MSEKQYENFKTAVLLAIAHQSDQKKCSLRFSYTFLLCNCSRQNDDVN